MHEEKFADSYDYVKRVLLHAIAKPDKWIVHPMLFRKKGGGLDLDDYAKFLGLTRTAVINEKNMDGRRLTIQSLQQDVAGYSHPYLFLDPDTGIDANERSKKNTHLTVSQVAKITKERKGKIVLVFDHAFDDGGIAEDKVRNKLNLFRNQIPWLYRAAVIVREHRCVCFMWLSTEQREVQKVTRKLRDELAIPKSKLLRVS